MNKTKKVALVTGASAGLGHEFAKQLAGQGCELVLVARRDNVLENIAAEIVENWPGTLITTIKADLSEPSAPREIFDELLELGVSPNYLINNAGSAGPDFFDEIPWEEHLNYMTLMQTSVAEMCHRFIPKMLEKKFGRVINVSSVAGRISRAGDCHYGPMKAYLVALSEALNASTHNHGVNVSALCPGFTHTDFHQVGDLEEMKEKTPKFIWYSAQTVVEEGLRAVEKGRSIQVSGRLYRWIDPLFQSVWTRKIFRINRQ